MWKNLGAVKGGIHLTIKTYSVYKQKLFELWKVQSHQIHVKSVSNTWVHLMT
jgi:hypothetical protein